MITLCVTHIERTQKVEPVVIGRQRTFRIRNVQLPKVSVDGNGKDWHFDTVAFDFALVELGCDPGCQLDHRVLLDVPPLDFYVYEQRSQVGKVRSLVKTCRVILRELSSLQ